MNSLLLSWVLATANFPSVIQSLSGKPAPGCALCHQNGVVGRGTVKTPFGAAMMSQGMVASDETALRAAWSRLQTAKTDSDQDGVSDVDELTQGQDPNVANFTGTDGGSSSGTGNSTPPPAPSYGCQTTSQSVWPWAAVLLLVRRRRSEDV